MSKNKSFRQTPIPHRSKSGELMRYFVISENGDETVVTRDICLSPLDIPDGEYPQRWFVDEESGLVARLPRNELGETIARENMRSVWNEAKYQERLRACQFKETEKCDGWKPSEDGIKRCDHCDHRLTSRTVDLDMLISPENDAEGLFEPADPFDLAAFVEDIALLDTLGNALGKLSQEDYSLVECIFLHCMTERELAPLLGLKEPKSVNKRKNKILAQLRKELKHFKK